MIPSPSTNLSTSPNEVEPSNTAASYGPGQDAVADVTLRIGNKGATLQIVTGGIRLPGNLPDLNE